MSQTLRQQLRPFFLRIHPDVLPTETRALNTVALQELNGFLDILASPSSFPCVGRTISLFVLRSNGRVRPCTLSLPPLSPDADFLDKEQIGQRLSALISSLLLAVDSSICAVPVLLPKVRANLDTPSQLRYLWKKETRRTREEQLLGNVYAVLGNGIILTLSSLVVVLVGLVLVVVVLKTSGYLTTSSEY